MPPQPWQQLGLKLSSKWKSGEWMIEWSGDKDVRNNVIGKEGTLMFLLAALNPFNVHIRAYGYDQCFNRYCENQWR